MKPTVGKAEKQVQIQTRRVCVLIVLEHGMYDKLYIDCAVCVKNVRCAKPGVTFLTNLLAVQQKLFLMFV